jgi:hypothetical protein
MNTKIQLTLTYYKTNKDYDNGTAIIEPYDPEDNKQISISFIKDGTTWILQQPENCKIRQIFCPEIILSQLNEKCCDNDLADTLKINKNVYPTFHEYVYKEEYGYILK